MSLESYRLLMKLQESIIQTDEPMTLSSGGSSNTFIDGKRALASGEHLHTASLAIMKMVQSLRIHWDAVGGLTLGADHLAHGIAIVSGCEWFTVRKFSKGRGTNRKIEGSILGEGKSVLLVDDVVTTGFSVRVAYDAVVATGANVVAAASLVDRQVEYRSLFEDEGIPYVPFCTLSDLMTLDAGTPRE